MQDQRDERMTAHSTSLDFLFFTTSDAKSSRSDELRRLLLSIEQAVSRHGIRVQLYLLMQNMEDRALPANLPSWVKPMACARLVPLASARNMMMAAARQDGAFGKASIVAFPDDDAWYPVDILSFVRERFRERPGLTLFSCRYGSRTVSAQTHETQDVSLGKIVRHLSSITIFLRSDCAATTAFDERLGLGAPIAGGEDLDYSLRAGGNRALFIDAPLIGHRDRVASVAARYYEGALCALRRSATKDASTFLQFFRKVAVGAAFVASGRMPVMRYLQALRLAARFPQAPIDRTRPS